MRQSNLNAYNHFMKNVGKNVTPSALLKILGTSTATAGGGPAGHVSHLRTVNGLDIETVKNGREVKHYIMKSAPKKEPTEVTEHNERTARIVANKDAKANATSKTPEERAAARAASKAKKEADAKKAARIAAAAKGKATKASKKAKTAPLTGEAAPVEVHGTAPAELA